MTTEQAFHLPSRDLSTSALFWPFKGVTNAFAPVSNAFADVSWASIGISENRLQASLTYYNAHSPLSTAILLGCTSLHGHACRHLLIGCHPVITQHAFWSALLACEGHQTCLGGTEMMSNAIFWTLQRWTQQCYYRYLSGRVLRESSTAYSSLQRKLQS